MDICNADQVRVIRREGYSQRIRAKLRVNNQADQPVDFSLPGYTVRLEWHIKGYTDRAAVVTKTSTVTTDPEVVTVVILASELAGLTENQYSELIWLEDVDGNELLILAREISLGFTKSIAPGSDGLTITVDSRIQVLDITLQQSIVQVMGSAPSTGNFVFPYTLPFILN